MATFIVYLMALLLAVGFGFLLLVVWVDRQVMSSIMELDGRIFLHPCLSSQTSSVQSYRLLITSFCALQPLLSELLGSAHQGGVSYVYIIGAAITHRQDTPTGS